VRFASGYLSFKDFHSGESGLLDTNTMSYILQLYSMFLEVSSELR
jgi:hypothetical protein